MRLPQGLVDATIRRRMWRSLRRLPLDRFRLRIAHTAEEHEDAFRLVRMAFAVEGYSPVRGPEMRIGPHHVLPEATVWIATEGEQIVGTITVVVDSPAGLPLDADYRTQLQVLRSDPTTRLAELGALAVVQRVRHRGVLPLLQIAALWFSHAVAKATHIVCGVNPKAAAYHRAVFGFESMGASHEHAELDAPVQGLCVPFEEMGVHVARHFRRPLPTGGLFHEHLLEALPPSIAAPPSTNLADLVRWKLPRQVFQELFIRRSDRLLSLDTNTREHLYSWRTQGTVTGGTAPDRNAGKWN